MSELIQQNDSRATIRWKLLTGTSALALAACISSAVPARAEDSSQPEVWIELGGELTRLATPRETFAPDLFDARPAIFSPSQEFEKPPRYSIDQYGSIFFHPDNSDWTFGASLRYGRADANKHAHQQTYPQKVMKYLGTFQTPLYPVAARFADTTFHDREQHFIVDFQAGRDVGLGLLNAKSSSTVSLGIRFAQFKSDSNIALKSDPDWYFKPKYLYGGHFFEQPYHTNRADFDAQRSFRGVGPSLSWKASTAIMGDPQDSELVLDWGINAALLFGKQRTHVQHQATGLYQTGFVYNPPPPYVTYHPAPVNVTRTRNVIAPNIGGFAGLSFRYVDAKISVGYRADFFFNAIDGGIDARIAENRGFFGPFASVSIGLGD